MRPCSNPQRTEETPSKSRVFLPPLHVSFAKTQRLVTIQSPESHLGVHFPDLALQVLRAHVIVYFVDLGAGNTDEPLGFMTFLAALSQTTSVRYQEKGSDPNGTYLRK